LALAQHRHDSRARDRRDVRETEHVVRKPRVPRLGSGQREIEQEHDRSLSEPSTIDASANDKSTARND
jgi:hypothetical protein